MTMLFFRGRQKLLLHYGEQFRRARSVSIASRLFELSLVHDLDKPDQADHEQRGEHLREQNQFHRRNSSSFLSCRILLLMRLKFPFRRFLIGLVDAPLRFLSGHRDGFRIGMRPAMSEVPIISNPVFASVADDGSVGLLNFQQSKTESHLGDLTEQQVAEVLQTCRPVHDFQPKCLTGSCHVLLQSFIERIMKVDQHAVIVIFLEPRFDLRVEVAKKRADIAITLHLEVASHSVAMTVKIAAFILQRLISVCGVKLVLFLNDHANLLTSVFSGPEWLISSAC
jgi:hypothetical protein